MNPRQDLIDQLTADRERIIELVQQLIQIPSENPPGDTTELCAFVVDYLGRQGVDYEIVAVEPTMPNVIAHMPPGRLPSRRPRGLERRPALR
jgi:succinyl-diaminopimelate desuccinylase